MLSWILNNQENIFRSKVFKNSLKNLADYNIQNVNQEFVGLITFMIKYSILI